jgi:catechol 2,3-dioxygenase-like lactoylglutathione lyase family enzyme
MNALASFTLACGLAAVTLTNLPAQEQRAPMDEPVQLGNFSISLAVKDIEASKAFYEKLGFREVDGKLEQKWLVLQNGTTNVGLFQGMFERNMLTFNPGWTHEKEQMEDFQDVRELQRLLKERGLEMQTEADEATDGPASFVLVDPDGNPILVDQHVASPGE